jgi:hypothetical protein
MFNSFIRMTNSLVFSLLSVLLIASFCMPVQAQEFRGTIRGRVTDSSGAVIPNASIIASGPQQKYEAKSGADGTFTITFVQPATYTISIEAKGFKTEVKENVVVDISSKVDLTSALQVGAATETVTVQAQGSSLLQTEDASGGTVMDPQKIQGLPNSGRLVYNLLSLVPGAQFTQTQFGSSGFSGTRAWDENNAYAFNGQSGNMNLFSLNGAPISTPNGGGNGTWNVAPSIDSIQEFKVMQNTYDAQYGRYAGGAVNTILKSGSKQYHGTASDNWRNSVLDANTYDRNQTNQKKLYHNEHQFDVTFGGPVLPHHDRLFFFYSYEGYRQLQPAGVLTSVPTADMQPGSAPGGGVDLTNYLTAIGEIGPNSPGNKTIGIFSPNAPLTCIVPSGAGCNKYERTPYANNIIPANEITPIAAKILALYPKPNLPGYVNNYAFGGASTHTYNQHLATVAYNLTDSTKISTTFVWWSGLEYRNGSGFLGAAANGNINNYRSDLTPSIDVTHTFSPKLFLDVRLGLNRTRDVGPNGTVAAGLATLNASDLGLTLPSVPTTNRTWAPQIGVGGYNTLIGNQANPTIFETYSLSPSVTQVIGHHNLHYGGDYWLFHNANPGPGNPNGNFGFGTGYTWENPNYGNNTGANIADLLLGYPDNGSQEIRYTTYKAYKYFAGFIQDDWKVSRRLSLNLGLRWDTETSPVDRHNYLLAGLCLTCVNSLSSKVVLPGTLPNGGTTPTQLLGAVQFSGPNLTPYANTWGALQPKFGFSYLILPKLVARGGWGLQAGEGIELGGASAWDQTTNYNAQLNSQTWQPTQDFKSGKPFPNGLTPVLGTSLGDQTLVGNGVSIDQRDRLLEHTQQYSFGFQGELPGGIIGDLEYAGTYASNLRTSRQLNGLSASDFQKGIANPNYLDQQVANPFYGVLPTTVGLGQNPTIAAKYLMVPYPEFYGNVYIYTHANGYNYYNSLIAKAEKRISNGKAFSRGLSFLSSFTWAKLMSATGYLNNNGAGAVDPENSPAYHLNAGSQPMWQLSFSGLYNLPVGKGGYLLSSAHGVLGEAINDWQLGWIFQNRAGWDISLPNSVIYNCGRYTGVPQHKSYSSWLDNSRPSCWQNEPEYYLVTYNATQQVVKQPWAQQTSLSLEKVFSIKEPVKLLFKAEGFNFTNTPIFGGPNTGGPQNPITRITSVANPNQPGAWSGYGTIGSQQQNFPRQFQFTAKLQF